MHGGFERLAVRLAQRPFRCFDDPVQCFPSTSSRRREGLRILYWLSNLRKRRVSGQPEHLFNGAVRAFVWLEALPRPVVRPSEFQFGRAVTGAATTTGIDEGFGEVNRMAVELLPVSGQCARDAPENVPMPDAAPGPREGSGTLCCRRRSGCCVCALRQTSRYDDRGCPDGAVPNSMPCRRWGVAFPHNVPTPDTSHARQPAAHSQDSDDVPRGC